jgi:hypothetical protein
MMSLRQTSAALAAIALLGAAGLTSAATARADDGRVAAASAEDTRELPRGSVTFRTERYQLSDRAVVTTSPTTIRIVDDSARTKDGHRTSLYVQFGYALDAGNPTLLRVTSGVAIRGYDFATGTYDESQAIEIGPGALSLDSPIWSEATHAWGHLNSNVERGIDLDVHGLHFGQPS